MGLTINERATRIKALICDVDGVLTDRKLHIPEVNDLMRSFDVHDGFGMRLWVRCGLIGVILSGGSSSVISKRAQMLGFDHVYMSNENKLIGYEDFLAKSGLKPDETCFVADDLFDLTVFERVGLSVAVADAHFVLRRKAHWVTRSSGGRGAVREVVDFILYLQNKHPYQAYFLESDFSLIGQTI